MPVNIIDTLKPKNGGSFPIVEAIDVFVENYGNLAEAVSHFATDVMIEAINTVLSGKANKSDVNTAVANLQGQINQIVISASAEAVVAPEVAAARVDADGTSHQTLKDRLDSDTAEREASENKIIGRVYQRQALSINGYKNLLNSAEFVKDHYYKSDNPGNKSISSESYSYFILELTANTTYYISGKVRYISKESGTIIETTEVTQFTPISTDTYYITFRNSSDHWKIATVQDMTNITSFQYIDELQSNIDSVQSYSETVNSSVNEVKGYIETSKNLLKNAEVVVGKYYSTAELSGANYSYFKEIPVESGKTYVLNFEARYISKLNSSKQYVEYFEKARTYEATSDGYINVTINNTVYDYNDLKLVENTVNFDDVAPYSKEITDNLISNEISESAKKSIWTEYNLYNKDEVEEGYLYADGNIAATTSYYTSDYIPIEAGNHYFISKCRKLLEYNPQKQSIQSSFVDAWLTNYDYVATTTGYLRISVATADVNTTILNDATPDVSNKKIPEGVHFSNLLYNKILEIIEKERIPSDKLYGKKWCVIGDSFTYAGYSPMNTFDSGIYKGSRKVYPYYIGNRTGIDIVDFSAGGRTLAFPEIPGDFTNSITCPTANCYYQNIPADTEYITIYLGINDSHHASGGGDGEDPTGYIPLGTIDDTTTASFGGAWNVVLSWLITNRPNAHIGIIVSNGCDSDDYRTLTIAIAKKYGIPYIDLNGDQTTPAMIRTTNPTIDASVKAALINKWAVAAPSNTHPNDDAHEFESHCIEAFLRRI